MVWCGQSIKQPALVNLAAMHTPGKSRTNSSAMDAAAGSSSCRALRIIVIFPWLAFGHLHPYLELAERLALRGHNN
ncbi:hypothetical protein PR202_gb11714 [Eleusine coracana subsp. coracana]|uniref:Uncharacterized protein n=1 Tax=Eleusine coracana subsp. coracana TaxID=191504 RepID=A0AAV5EP14_ELECO|nr:hypothetical protein PR202_gb11714 [Eleusine coracana subsp. coracana]